MCSCIRFKIWQHPAYSSSRSIFSRKTEKHDSMSSDPWWIFISQSFQLSNKCRKSMEFGLLTFKHAWFHDIQLGWNLLWFNHEIKPRQMLDFLKLFHCKSHLSYLVFLKLSLCHFAGLPRMCCTMYLCWNKRNACKYLQFSIESYEHSYIYIYIYMYLDLICVLPKTIMETVYFTSKQNRETVCIDVKI